MKKHIPQWAVRIWCWLKFDHEMQRFAAWQDGIQVIVYTCRCGTAQTRHVLPANRTIRRSLRR